MAVKRTKVVVKVELPAGKLGLTAVGSPPAVGAVRTDSPVAGQVAPGDIIVSLTRPGMGDVDTTSMDGQAVMETLVAFAEREGRSLTVEKDGLYGVGVPPGPLGVSFVDCTCTVHAVKPTSHLLGAALAGDTLFSVNGKPVTPTTILDDIKAADDGTSERKLVFRTTSPAMKAEGTPAGMTAGGTWVEQTYVGPQTSQCACLACLCFGLPGLCVLCFPTDKRMVYVNLGANAKPGPGKAALPDGSIVNYSKGGGSGPMIQRGPTAPIITEPGREVP